MAARAEGARQLGSAGVKPGVQTAAPLTILPRVQPADTDVVVHQATGPAFYAQVGPALASVAVVGSAALLLTLKAGHLVLAALTEAAGTQRATETTAVLIAFIETVERLRALRSHDELLASAVQMATSPQPAEFVGALGQVALVGTAGGAALRSALVGALAEIAASTDDRTINRPAVGVGGEHAADRLTISDQHLVDANAVAEAAGASGVTRDVARVARCDLER